MTCLRRIAAIAATIGASLLPATPGFAIGPVPDPPPDLLNVPTVAVTPTGDGAVVEVGAGGTTLSAGAGTSGVSVTQRPRAGTGATAPEPALPVTTPGDRPGRSASAPPIGDGAGVLFGPSPVAGASAERRLGRLRPGSVVRPGSTSEPRSRSADAPTLGRRTTRLPPFLEFVERIPAVVRAGVVALVLLALGLWAAWVRQRRRFDRNAFVDPVTGLANAPAFDGLLARELERARRYKRPLALLVLDLHDVHHGRLLAPLDQTLRNATHAIQDRVRRGDIMARLGPTRFAVICPEATAVSAETLARGIELRLEELRLHVTIGTAERQATDLEPGHLEARAEAAMTELPEPNEAKPRPAVLHAA